MSKLKRPSALKVILDKSANDADELALNNLMTFMLNKVEENIIKEICDDHVKSFLKLSESFPVYLTSQVLSKELGDNCDICRRNSTVVL